MAIKKKASKKKVAKKKAASKKVVAKKKVVAAAKSADVVNSLRDQLKAAKAENRELAKKIREGDRKVQVLLKLLDSSQADVNKFLTRRVKDAVAKYDIALAPKKKRRRKAKKKAAKK